MIVDPTFQQIDTDISHQIGAQIDYIYITFMACSL